MSVPPVMSVGLHADPILARHDHRAALDELVGERAEVIGAALRHRNVAARHRTGEQQRARDDAVGDDLVLHAVQFVDAIDDDRVAALAGDLRAHRDEEVRQIDDLGFHRDVVERRRSVGENRREHRVLRGADARTCETRRSRRAAAAPRDWAIR